MSQAHTSTHYRLRKVKPEDLMLIYRWANDDEVGANSFSKEQISLVDHKKWLTEKTNDPDCFFYIFIYDEIPVGQIRVDAENETGFISYGIAKEYHAQGYGRLMLAELERVIRRDDLPIKTLVAEVKPDNVASQKKFEEAGYEKDELIRYKKVLTDCSETFDTPGLEPSGGVLLLTNNRVAFTVYDWLRSRGYVVRLYSGRLNLEMIQRICPDFVISYNYRFIIQADIIRLVSDRIINMHISYLPWNRGASPNLWSFLDDTPKGVTIHKLSADLDRGDILCQKEISFDDKIESLRTSYSILHQVIQQLLYENWENILCGNIKAYPQSGSGSYHTKYETEDIMSKLKTSYDEPIADIKNRFRLLQKE